MNFNKKNTTIVTSFATLVIVVMSFVFYTSSQELEIQESMVNTISKNQTGDSLAKKRTYKLLTISENTNPIIIKGVKIDFGKNEAENQLINQQDNSTKKIDQIAKDLKNQSASNLNKDSILLPKNSIKPLEVKNDNSFVQKTSENTTNTPVNAPIVQQPIIQQAPVPVVQPLPAPAPVANIVIEQPKPIVQAPVPVVQNTVEEKTSYTRYIRSLNILKARGGVILIPITDNNIYQLDFSADVNINTVLSYEYDKNEEVKGYQSFGSDTHLRFLKCEAYIANCKSIIVRDGNGRYALILPNIEYYSN